MGCSQSGSHIASKAEWKRIRDTLPYGRTPEEFKKRSELYDKFDIKNTGHLTFADAKQGSHKVLGLDKLIPPNELDPVLRHAFLAAAGADEALGLSNADGQHVERREFRLFLAYIYDFFELHTAFAKVDKDNSNKITVKEFSEAIPWFKKQGVEISDPDAAFKEIDKDGSSFVSFDEFVQWAIKKHFAIDKEKDE